MLFDTFSSKPSLITQWTAHQNSIFELALTVDEMRLLTASGDTTCRAFDTRTGQCLTVFKGHIGTVKSIKSHPTDQSLYLFLGDRREKRCIVRQICSSLEVAMARSCFGTRVLIPNRSWLFVHCLYLQLQLRPHLCLHQSMTLCSTSRSLSFIEHTLLPIRLPLSRVQCKALPPANERRRLCAPPPPLSPPAPLAPPLAQRQLKILLNLRRVLPLPL